MTALERPDHFAATQLGHSGSVISENNKVRYHYQLQIEAEADSLCRVLNLFALQCLTPHEVNMRQHADLLHLDLAIDGLSWHRAQLIEQKMRNLICVCEVALRTALLSEMPRGNTRQLF